MKKLYLIAFFVLTFVTGFSQKIITEATISYTVAVSSGKPDPSIADAFDGATLTIYMKGNDVRSDFKSILRTQSILFDYKQGSAVLLKESGAEKYMIPLTSTQWVQYNRKYEGLQFSYIQDGGKTIAGYACKKAIGTLKDGSKITVFYSPDIVPLSPGYEYCFKDLPGMPLEYEVTSGNMVVQYQAQSVQFEAINASKFDLPKSGYKILEYKQ